MPELPAHLLRSAADGELDAAEAARVQEAAEADAETAARIDFERALRARVADVLSEATPPADLHRRVVAALEAAEPDPVVGRVEGGAAAPRKSWFEGPTRANFGAVAAVLVLVAGAILFGIFGPHIDEVADPARGQATAEQLVEETIQHVDREHGICATDPTVRLGKLAWTTPDRAAFEISRHLGTALPIADLGELDYVFCGAGECELPGPSPSCQVLYRRDRSAGPDGPFPMASVFVMLNDGQYGPLGPERSSILAPADPKACCGRTVRQMTDGRVILLVVCCDPGDLDAVAQRVAATFHCSAPAGR